MLKLVYLTCNQMKFRSISYGIFYSRNRYIRIACPSVLTTCGELVADLPYQAIGMRPPSDSITRNAKHENTLDPNNKGRDRDEAN